jgi:hypothetical protein
MQMLVAPAERGLQRVMQVGDGAVAPHQQPAPDHRADPANPYVEPINLETAVVCHGWLSLTNDWFRPQPPVCSALGGIYLFLNAKRDQLKVIFFRRKCYAEIRKWLPRGTLQLPALRPGRATVVLKRTELDHLLQLSRP